VVGQLDSAALNMFKLPYPPRFCELMDAESCLSPDGTDAWSRAKDEGTALFKAGKWAEAVAKYLDAEKRALSSVWRVRPLLCGGLHARSTSPLRILGSGEPALLEQIIELVLSQSYEERFAARLDITTRPLGRRNSRGQSTGEYVPTGARSDHPDGYPHMRHSEKLLYCDRRSHPNRTRAARRLAPAQQERCDCGRQRGGGVHEAG
jgi:hypothetical protein